MPDRMVIQNGLNSPHLVFATKILGNADEYGQPGESVMGFRCVLVFFSCR